MKISNAPTTDFPLYSSEGTFRSLWQKYYVYRDKLVLKTLLSKITIPFDEFDKVEIHPPNLKVMFKTNWFSKKFMPALKIDWADFNEHLAIYKKSGFIRVFLMTPDNLKMFKEYLGKAVENYHKGKV